MTNTTSHLKRESESGDQKVDVTMNKYIKRMTRPAFLLASSFVLSYATDRVVIHGRIELRRFVRILLMAHKPTPMSFMLAPSCYSSHFQAVLRSQFATAKVQLLVIQGKTGFAIAFFCQHLTCEMFNRLNHSILIIVMLCRHLT